MPANSILSPMSGSNGPTRPKTPRCGNYHLSGKGQLSPCCQPARYQLTLLDSGHINLLRRCQACRDELYAQIEQGVTFDILDEVPVELLAVSELGRQDAL